jgi:putative ABC transport system permease protein
MPNTLHGRLFGEIVMMAIATLREQKVRSGLTVLGIVIGITSIVGSTALIRGLDKSLRESIQAMGPDTIFVTQFSMASMGSGRELTELLRRPNLTPEDAEALKQQAPSLDSVNIVFGQGGQGTPERVYYQSERTKQISVYGATANYAEVFQRDVVAGRFFTPGETDRRTSVVVLGQTPLLALFPNIDPIGKRVRIGEQRYTVIGVMGTTPSPGGFNTGQDDFVVVPHTTYQKQFGVRAQQRRRQAILIAAVPREEADRDAALADIETVMRIRHRLRLDDENDFELLTQDAILALWDQISDATFLALIVVSSISLLVGGIGVMAIMTISVTERTREIGTRRAIGAKRKEILGQFLFEAAFLTSLGGVLGSAMGAAIGFGVHYATGFPISLPWWSFAIGLGFSTTVGIVFGLFPAIKASNLDPIEALRYD